MNEIVETDNKIVETDNKIVDFETLNKLIKKIPTTMSGLLQEEYVLKAVAEASGIENPRTFVEEFKRAEHAAKFWERSATNAWNQAEKAEHRAEVFERMAFKLKEERDLLVWLVGKGFNDANFCECDICANIEIFAKCRGGECKSCKEKCYCGFCRNGSGFVLDSERAKKLKEGK